MTYPSIKLFTVTMLGVLFANQNAKADLIWIQDEPGQPIACQIISQTDQEIEFRPFVDGKYRIARTIASEKAKQTVITLDAARLGKLIPERPEDYRDIAEELAAHHTDLAALDLARRLYLLSAYNSAGTLRSGSILGLISLATTDENLRRLKMLQLMDDPKSSKFDADQLNEFKQETPTQDEKQLMLKLVLALRQERSIEASNMLSSVENRDTFNKWSEHCTLGEFDRIATVNRPSKLQLSKLLTIEVMVRQPANHKVATRKQGWGDLAMQATGSLGVLPTFKNVTRFDPDQSVFRNGRWVKPSKK